MTSLRLNGRNRSWLRGLAWRGQRVSVLAAFCVGIMLIGAYMLALAPGAGADGRPPGGRFSDPVVRAVDIAQPSIVRIAAIYSARVTLTLCGQDVSLPASGGGYTLGATGSGAFVSANGDILTADHVVDVPKDLLDQAIFQEPTSSSDIANLLNTNPNCHLSQPISANDVAAGYVQYAGIPYAVHYSSPRRLVWQSTAFTGPVSNTSQSSTLQGLLAAPYHEATVVSSSSVNDNDVAIVHVDMSDTPNIQLDNSAAVAVEDQLTIIGYPGNGDVTDDGTDLLTPSVNIISISAVKSNDNGEQLIQVGGNVEHGDSGGPALDAQGHIVGIVSFGFVGPNSPGSTAFLRSSNSVRSLISAASLNTTPGPFERAWEAAFADYAASYSGHWHAAARALDDLSAHYPNFKGIQQYKDYADSAAAVEAPTSSLATQTVELAGGAAALLALIVVVATLLLMRARKRNRQPAYAVVSQALPDGAAYPYAYGAPGYGPPSQQFGGYGRPSTYGSLAGLVGPAPTPVPAPGSSGGWPHAGGNGFMLSQPMGSPPAPQASESPSGSRFDAPMGRMPSDVGYPPAGVTTNAPVVSHASQNGNAFAPGAGAAPSSSIGLPDPSRSAGGLVASAASAPISSTSPFQGYCSNGHPMPADERYCAQCGAPRWSAPGYYEGSYPGQR